MFIISQCWPEVSKAEIDEAAGPEEVLQPVPQSDVTLLHVKQVDKRGCDMQIPFVSLMI